ncbi:MAG TPA: glycosyltransferase family 2 protein [Vicinamibacterales bacterium]|nr:glycosyltransferase family 2 protein [Vicinamibacterales bacterium]
MKLIIQIPCLNEAASLPATLAELPRTLPGIDTIEYLVIDDGSSDGTADVARAHGVHHVIRFNRHRGLAAAFAAGIDAAVKQGADFIVNTDADNQYPGSQIATLIGPLLTGQFDVVIGDRNIRELSHMSWYKKLLQRGGSWAVRRVSNTAVPDTTSGFRAYTRDAALRMTIVSEFSYTLESIIQAGKRRMAIAHVEIATNARTRPSRLFDSIYGYVKRSAATIVRIYTMYEPLKVFTYIGSTVFLIGLALALRVVYYYFQGEVFRHVAAAVAAAMLLILGFQILLIGLVADAIASGRKLTEDVLYRLKKMELDAASRGRDDRSVS